MSHKVKQLLTKIVTNSTICFTLNFFLFNEKNVFMNIIIFTLDIAIGSAIQYELISMLKIYEGTNTKNYKIKTILGSIILWGVVWIFSSRNFYRIF